MTMRCETDIQSSVAGIVTASLKQLQCRCGADLSCPLNFLLIAYGTCPSHLPEDDPELGERI